MNMKELVGKANEGKLLPHELEEVIACLEGDICDPYEALLVLGRSGAIRYRNIVERYLRTSRSPMLTRLALMILCRYWGLTVEYKTDLELFIRKVEWDDDDDVRVLAISIAGSLLADQKDDHLLWLIIDIFRNRSGSERQTPREVAYCALALASGKKLQELPKASRHFDLERDVDVDVIAFIVSSEQRLAELQQK
jgi:hypothetical protein